VLFSLTFDRHLDRDEGGRLAARRMMYTIDVDPGRRLLLLTLEGFWEMETVRAFARDQQAAVARLGCAPGEHLVLADLSRFKIQSQEVVAMCKAFIDGATNSSRRLALVAGAGLARIQYKRVMGRDAMRMFPTIAEAQDWLFEDVPDAVPLRDAPHPRAHRIRTHSTIAGRL
jgi:hypothetical protein